MKKGCNRLKRRETTVAVIRTGIAYIAFAAALVFAAAQVTGGFDRLTAVAGASFVLILIGFSAQRVLVNILPGGVKEFDVELVASDREAAELLVHGVTQILPVNGFYTDLLKERAEKHLIVHGPVVLGVDEGATRSFTRANAASRWAGVR